MLSESCQSPLRMEPILSQLCEKTERLRLNETRRAYEQAEEILGSVKLCAAQGTEISGTASGNQCIAARQECHGRVGSHIIHGPRLRPGVSRGVVQECNGG